jgi:hypothetical protein
MNSIRPLLYWSTLLTFLAFNNFISAQDEEIRIKSKKAICDSETNTKLDGVQVIVFKNGAQEKVYDAGSSGKFDFNLPLGYSYDLKFSRADYVTKIMRVDTRNIPAEDRSTPFQVDMEPSLFKYVEGFNTDILKEPMGKAAFDSQTNYITFDFAYTETMKKKIEDEFKRLADLAKNGDKQKKEYEKLIQEGDAKMTGTKYQEAMDKYKSALALFPSDKPAQDKYDEAERKYNEFLASKNNDAQYTQLIKEADVLFKNKDWENAKTKYSEAVAMRNSENYPKNQITEIDKKLLELENEKKFKEIVARADQEFNSENFETCINSYQEALLLKSNDIYSKKQIDAAKLAMQAIANDKSKQEEIERRYKALLASADDLFAKKQYLECITKYKSASEIKPSEEYPIEQVDKANKALNANKPSTNNIPPAEDPNLAEYKKLITEADKLLQESNLNIESKLKEARAKYSSAQALKRNENYPTLQIKTIDQALDNLNNSTTTAGENWREKRLRQERELEEVRRLKEKELEESRAARLKEQKETEEEELRLKASQENKNPKRNIDLRAEEKVEEFYSDAQKKADRKKMLDIQIEKSRDSSNRALIIENEQKSIKKGNEEIEISKNELNKNSKKIKELKLKNQKELITELDNNKNEHDNNLLKQKSNLRSELKSIEYEKEVVSIARKKNFDDVVDEQIKTAHELKLYNDFSQQAEEKQKQALVKTSSQNKTEQESYINYQNENKKTLTTTLNLKQNQINIEKKAQENLKSNRDKFLEKNRMELNNEIHSKEIQTLGNSAKQEKAIERASKELEEQQKNNQKPVIIEEISEKSYETSQPSRNIIETTIKKGKQVTVYRKVVSKLGTIYYENDECISMDEWLIETRRK